MDIAYLRSIPGLTMMSPKDLPEMRAMMRFALEWGRGPVALRYPRGSGETIDSQTAPIHWGQSETLMHGDDLALVGFGPMVSVAMEAARILRDEHGLDVEVVNARWAKPLDTECLLQLGRRIGKVITLEDGVLAGGFGSAVAELYSDSGLKGVDVRRIGLPDHFVEHGPIPTLRKLIGMDAETVVRLAVEMTTKDGSKRA